MTSKDLDQERLALEKERVKIERARLALAIAQYEMQRRALRYQNRSFLDALDDFLFG